MLYKNLKYPLFIVVSWTISSYVLGNNSKTQEIIVNEISYDSLFVIIENKFDIHFSYFSNILPDTKISIHEKNILLTDLLQMIFTDTHIDYKIHNNLIIISHKIEKREELRVKGRLLKQGSNIPLPYATVEIKNKQFGTIADKNGFFELRVDEKFMNDSLMFSTMGYEALTLPVKHYLKGGEFKIYLAEKSYTIDEIDIYPEAIEHVETGNANGIPRGSLYLDTHGQQTAIWIENKKNKSGILNEVKYYLSKKGNTDAPLRIHIYSVDTANNSPGEELLPSMVVVKPAKDKGWTTVNLLAFDINIPVNGLFIGIEGVFPDDYSSFYNESSFKQEFHDNDNSDKQHILDEISYGQRIGYNAKGKNCTWHFSITQTWFQIDKRRFNVMMGATIIYKN